MDIPSGVTVRVEKNALVVEGPKGKLERTLPPGVSVSIEGPAVRLQHKAKKLTRRVRAQLGTLEAHLRNMVRGVQAPFEKTLQVVYSHFPVTVEVKGREVLIKNFLGEKMPREAKIKGAASVVVNGQEIIVAGSNKEDVGQTASNIARATRILRRDERVFQDGIYYA